MNFRNNGISSDTLENHVELENINKDILEVVDKYAKDKKNISVYGDDLTTRGGWFLMWVKKDMDMPPDEQIQITTFAKSINVNEITNSMNKVMSDMGREQQRPIDVV